MLALKAEGITIDTAEIRRALPVLLCGQGAHELRSLPAGRSRLVRAQDIAKAVDAAVALAESGQAVYYTLNPVRPDLGDVGAKNADILNRRWLLVDIDSNRPAKDVNASAEELGHAWALALEVISMLEAAGFANPVVIHTGNGFHLLYGVDLPANEYGRVVVKRILDRLAREFHGWAADIDTSVSNASRIARLPGTWNLKGPHSDDRPRRLCAMLDNYSTRTLTPLDALQAFAEIDGGNVDQPRPSPPPPLKLVTSSGTTDAYVRAAVAGEALKVATADKNRNTALYTAGIKLGSLVGAGALDEAKARQILTAAAEASGLGTDGDPKEIERALANSIPVGKASPREGIARPHPNISTEAKSDRIVVMASEITPRTLEWLWPGRVPLGKLVTFAGWGGLGKSFVTMDLAARLSRGEEIPCGRGECFDPCGTLIINTEDDPEDTSVPRLIEAGADLSRIGFLRTENLSGFVLDDYETLDRAMAEIPNLKMVVIDPATAHLGNANDHKNAELRRVLAPLQLWARERRAAVTLISHVNKPQAGKLEALSRIVGSVAWVNAVRAAAMFVQDPEDKGQVLCCWMKTNLGPMPDALKYKVVPSGGTARVEWLGTTSISAEEAMQADKKRPRKLEAYEWLSERFAEKKEWPSDELFDRGKQDGISRNALYEAAQDRSFVVKRKHTSPEGDTYWYWTRNPLSTSGSEK